MDATTPELTTVVLPSFSQFELAIREAWGGNLTRGRDYPGVLPERLENVAAQPLARKPRAADAARVAAIALGIHP